MVSVVLPAYVPTQQLREVTAACLESLEATTPRDSYELVVVDNGSERATGHWLRKLADTYIRKGEPIGYARATNIGLAIAEHDWLIVLNTDIQFCEEGWLERMLADYAETPGGVLSAQDEGRPGIVYDESWFSCWLTNREVIRRVGYFDESMGFRFHDQDYAIRVHRAGYRVMRTGNVPVSHINSATYNTMGRGEDPQEQQVMVGRWGYSLFNDWVRNGQPAPN